jgi:dihydroxyacetone kinase DhaKLM complex PTS-EIIA-like component DhaM
MTQTLTIKNIDYLVTDEETITKEDEMIFEVRSRRDVNSSYILGMWDDLLGSSVQKIWKIISKTKNKK